MIIQIAFFALAALAIAWIVTPLATRIAPKLGLVDQPGGRKIHNISIPRVGGIAFLAGVLGALALGFLVLTLDSRLTAVNQVSKLSVILIGTGLAAMLGMADDIWELRPSWKFLLQAVLTLSFSLFGYRFDYLHVPGFPLVALSTLSVPFTALWIMAVMNGFNFMDGVDGLAGCVTLVSLIGIGAAGFLQGDTSLWALVAASIGALVVFLAYNRAPARVYLGDTGASVLGFLSAASLVTLGQPKPWSLNLMNPSLEREPFQFQVILTSLMVGYPFLEVLLSTARRGIKKFYFGRSMEWSEKEHIHHRLLKLGLSPMRIAGICAAFNLLMVAAGLLVMTHQRALAVFCLLPMVFIIAVLMPRAGFFEFMDARSLSGKRSYYLMAHRFMEMQQVKLELVAGSQEVLALASQTCAEFGVQGFWIKGEPDAAGNGGVIFSWERPHDIQREYLQFIKTEITRGDFEVFRDRVSLDHEKIEAYWIFEPHTEESDLDVEYRVLVSGFMKSILRRIAELNRENHDNPTMQINNLAHANVRSSLLRQRYGKKKSGGGGAEPG